MKTSEQQINPEEYILAVLSPQERLDAALHVAHEAFRGDCSLTVEDVEDAVQKVKEEAVRQDAGQDKESSLMLRYLFRLLPSVAYLNRPVGYRL